MKATVSEGNDTGTDAFGLGVAINAIAYVELVTAGNILVVGLGDEVAEQCVIEVVSFLPLLFLGSLIGVQQASLNGFARVRCPDSNFDLIADIVFLEDLVGEEIVAHDCLSALISFET